jgi:tRNA nucleotidyltransferase (CCA-adding enzyme)
VRERARPFDNREPSSRLAGVSKGPRPGDILRKIPREVVELCRSFADKGYRAWVVGGCLRDVMIGRQPTDWDLATDARPEQVQRIFPKVLPTGVQHGTVTVRHRGQGYEVTTLRGEGGYSDGRRPDAVAFVTDIAQDLARRDFTINAMAYDPLGEALEDPHGGAGDLERRLIRAVGAPEQRFGEDGLRVLRAARFCATLEFELEPATEAAIAPTLDTFRKVSAERVRDEWLKTLRAAAAARGFAVMARSGILGVTLPELAALDPEAWRGSLRALELSAGADPILRLAALLWPCSRQPGAQPKAIADWLVRYRFSNQERERVLRLLAHAAPAPDLAASDAALRRAARAIGRGELEAVLALSVLLAQAHAADSGVTTRWSERMRALITPQTPLTHKELAVSGKDLMQALALPPGPKLGELLDALLEAVLDDPARNGAEPLLALARERLSGAGEQPGES